MKSLTFKWLFYVAVSSLLLLFMALPAYADSSVCFDCHEPERFKGGIVHAPVADGACVGCHSPHVSKNKGLLVDAQMPLCLSCHEDVGKRLEQSDYVHKPLQEGECSSCHDPHKSDNPSLLRYDLAGACYDCHDQPRTPQYGHQPFLDGECGSCHDPHSSSDVRLLKKSGPDLCFDCHDADKALSKKHLGRDLQGMDCLSCHNPHGSETATLVRSVLHRPFAEKSCASCHGQEEGIGMCLQCHAETLPTFNKVHNHLHGNGELNPCITCHDPHAGDEKGMFQQSVGSVCRSCHDDTFHRQEDTLYKHVEWENCTNCHSLHGSNHLAMLKNEPNDLCAGCHEDHSTFTHPIGDDALDPRTGQGMTCISCHDANVGTEFKYFLLGGADKGLCVRCHRGY